MARSWKPNKAPEVLFIVVSDKRYQQAIDEVATTLLDIVCQLKKEHDQGYHAPAQASKETKEAS